MVAAADTFHNKKRITTILIVEDEAVSRKALAALLHTSGYGVLAVGSAEEALELLEQGHVQPRFALIDLDLPGMNGLELIRQLERLSPHILAMLITATGRERLDRILENHHLLYFRKPLDFKALLSALAGG